MVLILNSSEGRFLADLGLWTQFPLTVAYDPLQTLSFLQTYRIRRHHRRG